MSKEYKDQVCGALRARGKIVPPKDKDPMCASARNGTEGDSRRTSGLRFCLVYPPFDDKRDRSAYYVAPPLGLLYIASYLEALGHSVVIRDFILDLKYGRLSAARNLYRECADAILSTSPDVVGFSTQCSTSPSSVNIAKLVKELRPQVINLFGGHDVSFLAQQYLEAFPFIDYVLAGEAELTVPMLAEVILGQTSPVDVPGLGFRLNGKPIFNTSQRRIDNLDTLRAPSYHLVNDLKDYFHVSRRPTILVDSGRGCAFSCEFCQTTLLNGSKVRYRSVSSLVEELKSYKSLYGDYEAYFVHDLFTARRSFVEELCGRLIEENLDLSWQCRCRLDQVDSQLLKLMSRAGCRMLLYGVESGSEKTLAVINKRYRSGVAKEIVQRVGWTVDAGIFPSLSMVIGIPEETANDLNATMLLAAEFVKIGRVNAFIQLLSPLPGTALANRLSHRLDYRGDSAPSAFSQGIEFCEGHRLSEDEVLIRKWPQIFQSFYTVTPDDGDLDIRIDVSLAFCKLLETYCHTFCGLANYLKISLLDLFRQFCGDLRSLRPGQLLRNIKDSEIWDVFSSFAARVLHESNAPELLNEMFRFERMLHDIAVSPPVPSTNAACQDSLELGPFRLRRAARAFHTEFDLPWISRERSESGEPRPFSSFLVFMTADRLQIAVLEPAMADALDILKSLNGSEDVPVSQYSRILQILAPLRAFDVFERIDDKAQVDRTPSMEGLLQKAV